MQIRLTVVDPLGPPSEPRGRAAACDVLVTAPAGTALAAVASGLAAAVGGSGGTSQGERGRESGGGQIVLYAGAERLDAQRCTLGEPPLTDGAVLSLGAPAEPGPDLDDVSAQLHVVAGPDAGGVHLLHGGQIRIGRSADADVPLDDPDVSRLHCAVTVTPEGRVSVADIGSTNGTTLDGSRVGGRPVPFTAGALLRVGESALRLAPPGNPGLVETAPDGEGHVRVRTGSAEDAQARPGGFAGDASPRPGGDAGVTPNHPGRYAEDTPNRSGRFTGQAPGRSGGSAGPAPAQAGGSVGHGTPAGDSAAARPVESAGHGAAAAGRPGSPRSTPPAAGGGFPEDGSPGTTAAGPGASQPRGAVPHARGESASLAQSGGLPPAGETHHAYGTAEWGASAGGVPGALEHGRAVPPAVPEQGRAPRIESGPRGSTTEGRGSGTSARETGRPAGSAGRDGTGPVDAGAFGPDASDTPGAGIPSARTGTPTHGTDIPPGARRRGGIGAWARRLAGGRGGPSPARDTYEDGAVAVEELLPAVRRSPESWPDPATLLLTAMGPGPRLWERGPGHPEALTVRLGTADRTAPDGSGLLPAVPVTAGLREAGSLGLAGPRARLSGLARAVVAQLAVLHSPDTLEIVLISTDRTRPVEERTAEWSWLGWLPHLRPAHGQDCRLLLAYDREQASARTDELLRRLEDHLAEAAEAPRVRRPLSGGAGATVPAARSGTHDTAAGRAGHVTPSGDDGSPGAARRPSWARADDADEGYDGPYTVVIVDGDPGGADVREGLTRLAYEGSRAGIHLVCLAETVAASPASPVTETYEAACEVSSAFRECGAVALLSGDVATALRLMRVAPGGSGERAAGAAPHGPDSGGRGSSGAAHASPAHSGARHAGATHTGIPRPASGRHTGSGGRADATASRTGRTSSGAGNPFPRGPVGHGTVAAVDAVSLAWAERFARSLAPLRTDGTTGDRHTRVSAPLPQTARLLDELGLARATPASLMARWADAADDSEAFGGRARAVLGAGPRGPVAVDLPVEGPHLLIEGPPGSGRTELLRSVAASLAAAERPDRLGIVLMDGRDGTAAHGGAGGGEGLQVCTDLPHVTTHLTANDPVRMREFAQSLSAELKRRSELLGRLGFAEWHAGRTVPGRIVAQRSGGSSSGGTSSLGASDLDTPSSSTLRLRPAAAHRQTEPGPPLARLVVVVDDLDALLAPPLGSPGRPAAGSVVRALEAVVREGDRLGVHLVAASGADGRTASSELTRSAALRVTLDAPSPGPEEPAPGRGRLRLPDGREIPFQGGRVTGRIPRTATLRPTVVPLEWHRMGDPPARRPVRELGNGPTDLALLASALERAARSVSATEMPSLL
ncbi:FHA domain-containing protein [Streptomyces sp. NPDC127077]|uniref:FHA domain-containing protein n=1 Tax=Streptomyces sp. NPDC127077 TaxID=3347131 RepID=UPI003663A2D5